MAISRSQKQLIAHLYSQLATIVAIVLLVIGGLALWANIFTTNMVHSELAAQKVYFPVKGSPALDPKTYPDLQQYAGQLVDTPAKAQAYANSYIGRHLVHIGEGKVYAEVSAEAQNDPTNQKLQTQKELLFQGETLRAILLISGYGFGTVGIIAGLAAYGAFIVSGLLFVAAYLLSRKSKKA
jgi:hypothetical protein